MKRLTDQEIVNGLIAGDNAITENFFFVRCRPLLLSIIRHVFPYPVDYDEMVSDLYEYLMRDDAAKLRQFQFRSSLYQWLKVVATRHFLQRRNSLMPEKSKENYIEKTPAEQTIDTARSVAARVDLNMLLGMMSNRRYADAIRQLILEDRSPESYAAELNVTVANLYNIKKRAISALTDLALRFYEYGR